MKRLHVDRRQSKKAAVKKNSKFDIVFCETERRVIQTWKLETRNKRYVSEYNMRHAKRGMAIIFNHEFFEIPSLKARAGTNLDCENISDTLRRLDFDVVVHKDLRFSEILQQIRTTKYYCFRIICVDCRIQMVLSSIFFILICFSCEFRPFRP